MCCGCGCRSRRAIPDRRSAAWMPAASSSCWIATTTGSARSSFRRAASTRCTRAGWRRSAPRSRGWRRILRDRVQELASWDDVKLLTVAVNRLDTWFRPGLLCIGDAAHAMSPVGGVGINLAIQDAVAAANILVPRLREGGATLDDLRAVQRRRELPTRMTQRVQVAIQNRIISNVLRGTDNAEAAARGADARTVSGAAAAARTHHRHGVPAGAYPALNRFLLRPPAATAGTDTAATNMDNRDQYAAPSVLPVRSDPLTRRSMSGRRRRRVAVPAPAPPANWAQRARQTVPDSQARRGTANRANRFSRIPAAARHTGSFRHFHRVPQVSARRGSTARR